MTALISTPNTNSKNMMSDGKAAMGAKTATASHLSAHVPNNVDALLRFRGSSQESAGTISTNDEEFGDGSKAISIRSDAAGKNTGSLFGTFAIPPLHRFENRRGAVKKAVVLCVAMGVCFLGYTSFYHYDVLGSSGSTNGSASSGLNLQKLMRMKAGEIDEDLIEDLNNAGPSDLNALLEILQALGTRYCGPTSLLGDTYEKFNCDDPEKCGPKNWADACCYKHDSAFKMRDAKKWGVFTLPSFTCSHDDRFATCLAAARDGFEGKGPKEKWFTDDCDNPLGDEGMVIPAWANGAKCDTRGKGWGKPHPTNTTTYRGTGRMVKADFDAWFVATVAQKVYTLWQCTEIETRKCIDSCDCNDFWCDDSGFDCNTFGQPILNQAEAQRCLNSGPRKGKDACKTSKFLNSHKTRQTFAYTSSLP